MEVINEAVQYWSNVLYYKPQFRCTIRKLFGHRGQACDASVESHSDLVNFFCEHVEFNYIHQTDTVVLTSVGRRLIEPPGEQETSH